MKKINITNPMVIFFIVSFSAVLTTFGLYSITKSADPIVIEKDCPCLGQ